MNLPVNHLVFCLLYSVGVPFGNGIDSEENEVEKSLTMEGDVSLYQQFVFQRKFCELLDIKILSPFIIYLTHILKFSCIY